MSRETFYGYTSAKILSGNSSQATFFAAKWQGLSGLIAGGELAHIPSKGRNDIRDALQSQLRFWAA